MIQRQLLVQAVLALAERRHTPPDRSHMLADAQVDALDEGGVDLPTVHYQPLRDPVQGAKHHVVPHADQAPAPHGLDDLRIQRIFPPNFGEMRAISECYLNPCFIM